jgi:hypothetical protein
MALSGGGLPPAAYKRMMPNRCLDIPRNEILSRFCLDNGLLIDVAANATRWQPPDYKKYERDTGLSTATETM